MVYSIDNSSEVRIVQSKYIRKILCAMLLCVILTDVSAGMRTEGAAQAASSTIYVVFPNKLNIRSDPSVDSYILARLKRGTLVKKLHSKNGWWYVQLKNGNEGYVDPKFLTEYGTDSSDSSYTTASGKLYYINSISKVKVRSGPSASTKVKGKIRGGTVVRLLGMSGAYGYIEVYNNGNRGYVPLGLLLKY